MAWFVLDTAMSAHYGVTYNVLLNVLLLAAFAIPLALCRSAFTADLDEEIFP